MNLFMWVLILTDTNWGLIRICPVLKKGNHVIAYWAVDDIQKTVNESIAKGAKLISPVRNVGGTIEVAIVEDPFGNHLGLIAGA